MKTESIIIGILAILICALPFIIQFRTRRKKEKNLFQSILKISNQNGCKITEHEFCGDFIIGFDEVRKFIFFFKLKNGQEVSQFVDLSKIQSCYDIKNKHQIMEHIFLCFTYKNRNQNDTKFELYDAEVNLQLSGEFQLVDKWVNKVNEVLKNS